MATPDHSTRSDAPLIKFLNKRDHWNVPMDLRDHVEHVFSSMARTYNRLPLLCMPDDSEELFRYREDFLAVLHTQPLYRPFKDLLIEFPCGWLNLTLRVHHHSMTASDFPINASRLGTVWTRVRTAQDAANDAVFIMKQHYFPLVVQQHLMDYLIIEGWQYFHETLSEIITSDPTLTPEAREEFLGGNREEHVGHRMSPIPTYTFVPIDDAWNHAAYWHLDHQTFNDPIPTWCSGAAMGSINLDDEDPQSKVAQQEVHEDERDRRVMISRAFSVSTVLALMYWTEVATPVRVQPTIPKDSRTTKTAKLKPWLLPRQAHYITVDPNRLADYDHPSTRTVHDRHRPIPHRRRGHYRHYPDTGRWRVDRTFVRETFIGERQWQDAEGTTYTILEPSRPPQ